MGEAFGAGDDAERVPGDVEGGGEIVDDAVDGGLGAEEGGVLVEDVAFCGGGVGVWGCEGGVDDGEDLEDAGEAVGGGGEGDCCGSGGAAGGMAGTGGEEEGEWVGTGGGEEGGGEGVEDGLDLVQDVGTSDGLCSGGFGGFCACAVGVCAATGSCARSDLRGISICSIGTVQSGPFCGWIFWIGVVLHVLSLVVTGEMW